MESKLENTMISSTVSDKIDSVLPNIISMDYFMEPCRKILKVREQTHSGYCRRVKDFTVGRVGYGQVKFFGETDVRGLQLDTIVKFRKNQVAVYKEEEGSKPAIGYGLNKSAEVILIIHMDSEKEIGMLEPELRHVSMAQGADFISFNSETMEWKFSVNHFSRFGLNLDQEEEEDDVDEVMEEGGVVSDREGWLSHSLPAHLGLDPLKLKELKRVMCDEEEDMKRETPSLSLVKTDERVSISSRRRAPVPLIEYGMGNSGFGFSNTMKLALHNKVKSCWNNVNEDGGFFDLGGGIPLSGTDSRNVVDAGLFMGRSFRVGWGPGGVLVHSCSSGVSINLDRVAIDGVVRDEYGEVNEDLVDSCFISPFKLHHKYVHSRIVEVGFDSFKLDLREASVDPLYLSEICQNYIEVAEKRMNSPELSCPRTRLALAHQIMVWGLIRVLFSVIDGSLEKENVDVESLPLVRRAEFSCWVRESMYEMTSSDELEQILLLLTSRDIDGAVQLAAARGDVRLACLLSQAGGFPINRQDVEYQLHVLHKNNIDFNFLEDGRIRLYKLLSGDIHGALEGMHIDWRRFLGVFMWYHMAPDVELPSVFDAYHRLVVEGGAPHPLPLYIPQDDEGGRFDLAYYLMLLHAARENETNFPYLNEMFSASASTYDLLDHHMIWHQKSILEAIGVIESDDLHLLDMGVVSQLLCLGQCHWAIYVALHMCRRGEFPGLHMSLIREILFLYCETWSSRDEQYRFIESMGVPPEWMHESMAVYYNYYGDLKKAMEHYIGCSKWQKAHSIFVTSVSHSLFLKGEEEEIVGIVIEMEEHKSEIENWEVGAGLYSSFFFLKDALREPDLATLTSLENVCRDFFNALKESFILFDDKLPLDARVTYSKMAEEICDLLVSVGGDEVAAEAQLGRFAVVFTAPVPDHICSAHFQNSLSTFTSYLTHLSLQ